MKGLRGLFRLGTLTLLALTLMVAMALPSAAAGECSSSQMLDEVEIVSVEAKESPVVWSAQDLVDFDYDGDIDNGLLEVVFKDIPTDFDFDGYIIEAVPGDDDPGTSDALGVPDYKSPSLIARPAIVGSTVTEVLNLEPGTTYFVTVYAVNHNTVQISPDQRAQDSSSNTTLLSAPFLGGLEWGPTLIEGDSTATPATLPGDSCPAETGDCQPGWRSIGLADPQFEGTHFGFYTAEDEAGQHYFRWLNPTIYGPFDHVRNLTDPSEHADMLSLNEDGDVEDCSDDDLGDSCGHTHYQFKATDDNGNTVASELVETGVDFAEIDGDFAQVVYSSESGDLTLSVALGRMVGGKFKPMSDTASVMFEAPDDLRALDQTYLEYRRVLTDIAEDYDENDDAERWLGEDGTGDDRSIWNANPESSFADAFYGGDGEVGGTNDSTADPAVVDADDNQGILIAHLNTQLN